MSSGVRVYPSGGSRILHLNIGSRSGYRGGAYATIEPPEPPEGLSKARFSLEVLVVNQEILVVERRLS